MSTTKEDIAYQIELKRQARANIGLDGNHEGVDRLAERADKYKGMKPEKVAEYRSSHKWDTPAPSPVSRPMEVGDSGAGEKTVDEASDELMEVSDENKENPNAMEINEGAGDPSQTNDGKEGPNGGVDDEIEDPTSTGDYQTDKIKLETGDIIEYLFKDWILEGMAWCLNETGSIIGAAVYETARPLGHGLKKTWRWTRRKVTEGVSNVYHNHLNPDHNNLHDLRADHTAAVGELTTDIENISDSNKAGLAILRQNIGNRNITMDENGRLVDHRTPPQDLSHYHISKADYNSIRKKADDIHLVSMQRALGIDANDTQKMAELRSYYEQKASGQAIAKPNREFDKAFDNARAAYNQVNAELQDNLKILMLNKQAQLFAEHYSQFLIERKAKSDPLLFKNVKKWKFGKKRFSGSLGGLKRKEYAKAYAMFMQIQQARIAGKDLPSNETLIDMASAMRQQTIDGKPVKDVIKEQFEQSQAKKEEQLNLKDAAVADNNATSALLKDKEKLTAELATIGDPQSQQKYKELIERINKLTGRGNENGSADRRPSQSDRNVQSPTELVDFAIKNNGVLWNHHKLETMQAMYAIGMLSQDAEGHATLAGYNKVLMEQGVEKNTLTRYNLKIFKPSKEQLAQFKQEQVEYMAEYIEKIDPGYVADRKKLAASYDKFTKPGFKFDDKDREPYKAFKAAREQFKENHGIPSNDAIKQIVQRSTPQGQRSTPKTSGTPGKGGYNK